MMEKIEEQVKELREVAEMYDGLDGGDILREAADTIESLSAKLKAANMERQVEDCGGWISCSKKLPDENKEVICFLKNGTVYMCMLIHNRFHGKMYSYDASDVLCWKPLPNPPYEP